MKSPCNATREWPPLSASRESLHAVTKTQRSQKNKQTNKKNPQNLGGQWDLTFFSWLEISPASLAESHNDWYIFKLQNYCHSKFSQYSSPCIFIVTIFFSHDDTFKICCLQFNSVQSLSLVQLFATPMDYSKPGFPVRHQLPELTQTHVHWVDDAINHLITVLATFKYTVQFCSLSQHVVHYISRTYL